MASNQASANNKGTNGIVQQGTIASGPPMAPGGPTSIANFATII
jgi:hypothetical protein